MSFDAQKEFRHEITGDEPMEWLVEQLAQASNFYSRAVTFSGIQTRTYCIFAGLLRHGPKVESAWQEMHQSGSPAARVYAAMGMHELDEARGRCALQALLLDVAELTSMSGCSRKSNTVGKMAQELLDNPHVLKFHLPRPK